MTGISRGLGAVILLVCGCGWPPPFAAMAEPAGGRPGARDVAVVIAPEEDAAIVLQAIRDARTTVLMQMYLLTDSDALGALLAAQAAGVSVRVLLEPTPYGAATANEPAFALLAAAGIDVRWARRAAGLTHAKFVIVDGRVVYLMTLNLTASGLRGNREYVAVDREPADVRAAEGLWNGDAVASDANARESEPAPGGAAPASGSAAGLVVSPLNARLSLGAAIDAARESLLVEMEELSDSDLVGRLGAARTRGVAVVVVAPEANRSAATTAALRRLVEGGVTVRLVGSPAIHAKAMVIDGRHLYIGSVNFTRTSLDQNREVGLLWTDPQAAARVAATIGSDAASGAAL